MAFMMEKRTLIFLHIPKTAGTTFRIFLEKQYGIATEENWEKGICYIYASKGNFNIWELAYNCPAYKPELLIGHFTYGIHRMIIGESDYITLLRNPVERILSNFSWTMQNVDDPYSPHFAKYKGWTLEQYIEEPFIKDGMTRSLIFREHRIPQNQWVEEAKKNLKSFKLFGLTEEFDKFIELGTEIFGWNVTDYTIENVSKQKIKPTKEQIKLIEKKCELDLELYEHATKLFHEF